MKIQFDLFTKIIFIYLFFQMCYVGAIASSGNLNAFIQGILWMIILDLFLMFVACLLIILRFFFIPSKPESLLPIEKTMERIHP